MKFEKVLNRPQETPPLPLPSHDDSPLEDVFDYRLYNNLAIYIMKQGVKGNFKTIAPIVNNGVVPPSWAIRIYYLNNEWTLHFAPHPNLSCDFSLRDEVESIIDDPDTKVLGHNHVAMVISAHMTTIESVVNKLIEAFRDRRLPGIESYPVDARFTTETSTTRYKIPVNFKAVEMFDEETYKKYLIIIKRLVDDKTIPDSEKEEVIRISKRFFKTKVLKKRDLTEINGLAEKYIDQHSKIKIALQYILSSKNN